MSARSASTSRLRLTHRDAFALSFGLLLGLALLKFGNPVILDQKIPTPTSLGDAWADPWPPRWGNALLALQLVAGVALAWSAKPRWSAFSGLWLLPVLWFAWQLASATQTADAALTTMTLLHFAGCLACYFLGALLLEGKRGLHWLLAGLLAAFTFCLVHAVNQRLVEFPRDREALIEGERTGWTNFPPGVVQQMKQDSLIVTTNGVDIANPVIVAKLTKGRVHGTLVYPNALASAVLLLMPIAGVIAITATRNLRPLVRWPVIALTVFLGSAGFFWTGSKSGWLLAVMLGGICLWRLDKPARWKWWGILVVVVFGLAVFAVRFHGYFASGSTSVGARFDYWRAAVQTAAEQPLFGSGPGTFQRPYARLKAPEAEMARLAHNDYLEQFSDSGLAGGLSYGAWITLLLVSLCRRVWRQKDPLAFALFLGLLGWFLHGFVEFGLYIPGLAWPAFVLAGVGVGWILNRVDNKQIAP